MKIEKIEKAHREKAISLIPAVFHQIEAPDYSPKGEGIFKKTAFYNEDFMDTLKVFGAYDGEYLIDIIATSNRGNRIALFFVNGSFHRQGVGKKLFQTVVENSTGKNNGKFLAIRCRSYHRLGLIGTNIEQNVNGINFTPMQFMKYIESEVTDI